MNNIYTKNFSAVVILLFIFLNATLSSAAVFTVTSTKDNGPGSLRSCIHQSNLKPGLDTINFKINSEGICNFQLASALPELTSPIYINGYSQKGSDYLHLKIMLSGSLKGNEINGLSLGAKAHHSTIKGLIISNHSGYGIAITKSNDCRIEGNWIGTNEKGERSSGNRRGGLLLTESKNCSIGGASAEQRNIISGNKKSGIAIQNHCTNLEVIGNYIGLNVSGTEKLPNEENGVFAEESMNIHIGQKQAGGSNIISGNGKSGIVLVSGSDHCFIQNNKVGTDFSGTKVLGNLENGIFIEHSVFGLIGGDDKDEKNLISGNEKSGIALAAQSNNTLIKGNFIGTFIKGSPGAGNGQNGIFIENSTNAIIGSRNQSERNIVCSNKGSGIVLIKGSNNTVVSGNYIGVGKDGKISGSNAENGIYIEKSMNALIGGKDNTERNIISSNLENGIFITQASDNCIVENNCIGFAADEFTHLSNHGKGLYIEDSQKITIVENLIDGNGSNGAIGTTKATNIFVKNNYVGVFYTVVYLLLLISILQYIIYRNDNFMYYLIYISVLALIVFNLNGILYNVYLPVWSNSRGASFIIGSLAVCLLYYTRSILNSKNTETTNRADDKSFKILIAVAVVFIFTLFLKYRIAEIITAIAFVVVASVFILKPLRLSLKNRYLPAFFYLIAWSIVFISTIIQLCSNFGFIPHEVWIADITEITASCLAAVFFTIGLGYQINLLTNENENARKQIVEYLREINIIKNPLEQEQGKIVHNTEFAFPKMDLKIKQEDVNSYALSPLTERELEVLSLIAAGKSNKEMAEMLFVSVNTIKSHILKTYQKLDVNNRIQAVAKASSLDILKLKN